GLGVPAPPEIDGELVEPGQALRQRWETGVTVHLCFRLRLAIGARFARADKRGKLCEIDIAARDHGDDFSAAGTTAERGGNRTAAGASGDEWRPRGGKLHGSDHLVERDHDGAVELRQQRPHRLDDRLAAGSINERRCPALEIHRPARRERGAEWGGGFGLSRIDLRPRTELAYSSGDS